jgi:cysteine sulfinate desulfinase/cysteine desulfurase-like protein
LQHVADLIGADPKDIVFTSGATETNNMAIKGVARFHKEKKKHIITTQTVRFFVLIPILILKDGVSPRYRSINACWILAGNFQRKVLR